MSFESFRNNDKSKQTYEDSHDNSRNYLVLPTFYLYQYHKFNTM